MKLRLLSRGRCARTGICEMDYSPPTLWGELPSVIDVFVEQEKIKRKFSRMAGLRVEFKYSKWKIIGVAEAEKVKIERYIVRVAKVRYEKKLAMDEFARVAAPRGGGPPGEHEDMEDLGRQIDIDNAIEMVMTKDQSELELLRGERGGGLLALCALNSSSA